MATDPYNVYDQTEAGASNGEDLDLQKLIQSYTDKLRALGAPESVTNNWYQALTKDISHGFSHPGSTTNAYGGDNPNGMISGAGILGLAATGGVGSPASWQQGFAGRKSWRKAQADAEHKRQLIDQMQAEMQTKVAEAKSKMLGARNQRQQTNLSTMVGGMFDDPSRKALYDRVYKSNLDLNLGQVQDAYKGALTSGVTRAADQGLLGGTVDTQRRADLGATRDRGAAAASSAAAGAAGSLKARDNGMRQYLMQMIQSGDPTMMASARAQLAQLDADHRTVDEGAAGNAGQWGYDDYNAQLQSQALGGFFGAANNGLKSSGYGSYGSGG